jgi:hypothetical protein
MGVRFKDVVVFSWSWRFLVEKRTISTVSHVTTDTYCDGQKVHRQKLEFVGEHELYPTGPIFWRQLLQGSVTPRQDVVEIFWKKYFFE